MTFRLGKLPATRPHGLKTLGAYTLGALPTPPSKVAVPNGDFSDIFGNNKYGDCTIAAAAHLLVAANAEVGATDTLPTDDIVEAQYFAITGGQDAGCNEADVLARWYKSGLFGGNKIAGYAPCDLGQSEVYSAISLYGACYTGVQLPVSAQQQFADGTPWTVVDDDPIEGGHAIVFVGYDEHYLYASTWGKIHAVTYPWWRTYGDEAWVVIPHAFVEKGRGPLVDLNTLQRDLHALR